MALKLITDTSCNLPDSELEKYNIQMIPLKVTFDKGETFLDGFELGPANFVKKMKLSRYFPRLLLLISCLRTLSLPSGFSRFSSKNIQ